MARVDRELREARAVLVGEYAIKRRLDTIAFEEDVLYPALERVKEGTLKVAFTPSDPPKELEA